MVDSICMDTMTITLMTNSKTLRNFRNLADMERNLGCVRSDIELVKSTRTSFYVYVRGVLLGVAVKSSTTLNRANTTVLRAA